MYEGVLWNASFDEELKEIITGLCGDKKENYPLDELAASICNYYE